MDETDSFIHRSDMDETDVVHTSLRHGRNRYLPRRRCAKRVMCLPDCKLSASLFSARACPKLSVLLARSLRRRRRWAYLHCWRAALLPFLCICVCICVYIIKAWRGNWYWHGVRKRALHTSSTTVSTSTRQAVLRLLAPSLQQSPILDTQLCFVASTSGSRAHST